MRIGCGSGLLFVFDFNKTRTKCACKTKNRQIKIKTSAALIQSDRRQHQKEEIVQPIQNFSSSLFQIKLIANS